jgi:hypothetical protein
MEISGLEYNTITEVPTNQSIIVKLLLSDSRINPAARNNKAIFKSVERIHYDTFDILMNDNRIDPSDDDNETFINAVCYNNIYAVKRLLNDPRVDPTDQHNRALSLAVERLHYKILELLLSDPRINPSADNNSILNNLVIDTGESNQRTTARIFNSLLHNERQIFTNEELLNDILSHPMMRWVNLRQMELIDTILFNPRTHLFISNNETLCDTAIQCHNTKVVEKLLKHPKFDPTINDNQYIREAFTKKQRDIVKLFFDDERVNRSLSNNEEFRIKIRETLKEINELS